jgi:hypothetical protein
MVVVAHRRARVVRIIVPGTTAQHTGLVSGNPAEQQSAKQVWLLLGGNAKNARAIWTTEPGASAQAWALLALEWLRKIF